MNPNPPSRKGKPNKTTADVRAAIAVFAQANVDKMGEWLMGVADGDPEAERKPDPGKALDLYLRALEYHIPKLGRTEHSGVDGGPFQIVLGKGDAAL